ncbi:MAG: flagellar basal body-associated protein FliL [Synechococcaceae cyanobacterium SM1_2_3]|nr:flagellar basal body-associated protein FliL [Synechococcaceae cyanobacterium SM1_2_3]
MKKIILIAVAALILIGGSIGATLFLTGAFKKDAEAQAAGSADQHGGSAPAAPAAPAPGGAPVAGVKPVGLPSIYQAIDPPFIVNFEDQGILRYLQIGLAIQTRIPAVGEAITTHMPQIRNNLIMLFADQKLERLTTNEGKEQLRMQALTQIQAVLTREIGYPGVDAVYFTIFVLQ